MNRAAALRFAFMAAAAAALYGAARVFLALPCWSLVFAAGLFAWPMWRAQAEYALFERRAVLSGVTHDASPVRRWLWAGRVTRVFQVVSALFWAALLLGFAALLDARHWLVLALDVAVLALAFEPVRRRLARDVRAEHRSLVARRWPLTFLNLALLAVAFFALDFLGGAPDTRGLTWLAVFDQAWGSVQSACPVSGALVGALAAADRLAWHAAEVLIPSMARPELRLAAWAFFLLQAGLLAYAFTRLLLGAAALSERGAVSGRLAEGAFAPAFWVTLAVLAGAWLYASWRLQDFDAARLQDGTRSAMARANPCRPDPRSVEALSAGLAAELQAARAAAHQRADRQVDERLEAIFSEAELGVDRYLDWYFTVLGEYQRLGALAASELDEMMARELERHLFGDGMLGERMERASIAIAQDSQAQMSAVSTRLGLRVRQGVRENPCGLGALDLAPTAVVTRDVIRVSTAAGGGAMVGLVAVRSLGRGVAAATAKRTASKSVFRVAGGLLGKTVTKRGGTWAVGLGAAALCAPGGPLALVCGLGAAAASWIFFDHALIRIDEALFRDDMRREIVASLREQQGALADALKTQHRGAIDRMAAAADAAIERTFVPARDGLRQEGGQAPLR